MVQSTMPPAASESSDAGVQPKALKHPKKSARTRAREFALQGLYQHLVGKNPAEEIDPFTRDLMGFHKADAAHFDALLHGCIAQAAVLDTHIAQKVDRPLADLSPIEHGVLWIGTYEMLHCADVPWRAVINECIELAKEFGGTDGHKCVRPLRSRLAPSLRPDEVRAHRAAPAAP